MPPPALFFKRLMGTSQAVPAGHAATLTYAHTRELAEPTTFLVYDLGGGTFDVSVVTWDPEVEFELRAFDGDAFLGGYDFDRAIVNWMVGEQAGAYDLVGLDPDDPADRAGRPLRLDARLTRERFED